MASTIWKGHLTFGLVSIPIKLYRAARAEKIHMHRLDRRTGARVKQVFAPIEAEPAVPISPTISSPQVSTTGPSLVAARKQFVTPPEPPREAPAAPAVPDLVRGYEFEKNKYVAFEPEELEKLAPQATHDMQILEFVHFDEVDPVYLESSYYVAAGEGGDKPYALLFATLKKTGYAAIAEFVMHRRDQTMLLRAGQIGLIGHTLFYEDEVKRENAFEANSTLVAPQEMELAAKLVEALAAKFDPSKFKDKFRERLQDAISAKIESGVTTPQQPDARNTPVIDIMEALKQSLKAAKKPVASESKPVPAEPAKKKGKTGRA